MAAIKLLLKPFKVPNHVLLLNPLPNVAEAPIDLEDVDAQALSDLCDDFRREVFKLSGNTDPKINTNPFR